MPDNDAEQRVAVHVGSCRCSGAPDSPPHPDGDMVYLAPKASMTMGLKANGAVAKADDDQAMLELYLGRVFIEEGITGWTFVDEEGDTEAITPANIERLLPWGEGGSLVAERANDLYGVAIMAPLVLRSRQSSQPGPSNGSTSPKMPSRNTSRKSSRSSSPAPSVSTP